MMRHATAFAVLALAFGIATADARPRGDGWAALARGDYVRAAAALAPMARSGHPRAMTSLGYMYENGYGVPQSYDAAVELYIGAAERGDPTAQHLLGLSYDKGHGVYQDHVLAYKWLSLAAGAAPNRLREPYQRIRDAVAFKMSPDQVADGQRLALEWRSTLPGKVRATASASGL
ncbi:MULTISPECIES: tetratricopeptide repeat protein [unclassified Bradyrhizobium]|uniref:tetratricopeptide repeat protein n=1 Tax=unclassified Bradyrhizobium TaxID=2631580 RepID=UPI0028ECD95F|nr:MULTISPECIES: tetratricopeptide repeat protein [unclassified Bradyrhizobium]